MLLSYFKTAWRNFIHNKGFSFINMAGLVTAVTCSLLLLGYVSFQKSYDGFHAKAHDVYRVNLHYYEQGKLVYASAENYPGLASAIKSSIPAVKEVCRFYNLGSKNTCVFSANNRSFRETKFLYADAAFLTMFTIPLFYGNATVALSEPNTAILSNSTAHKYFGDENPVGKTIQVTDDDRNREDCIITGVFKDLPANMHIQADIVFSYETLKARKGGMDRFETSWSRKDFYTYVLLAPGSNPATVAQQLPRLVQQYRPEEKNTAVKSVLSLEPLQQLHFNHGLIDEPGTTVSVKTLQFLVLIAFFVLVIAWVNYINITTAGSFRRAKEIGVRKVLGSQKSDLIKQFLIESVVVNGCSIMMGAGIVILLQPYFNQFFQCSFDLSQLFGSQLGMELAAVLVLGTLLAGLYPALVLSSFKPLSVLKGRIAKQPKGIIMRKSLLVFQYALSIFLIAGTLITYRQVDYMLKGDLGMQINGVIVLDRPGKWDTARSQHNGYVKRFKALLSQDPQIAAVGMSDELPGKEIRNPNLYRLPGASAKENIPIHTISIDENFVSALGFQLQAGRNFSAGIASDREGLLLTAAALTSFGFKDAPSAIGKKIYSDNHPYEVLGVVGNYHQLSLDKAAEPIVFQYNNADAREFEYYLVKPKNGAAATSLSAVKKAWDEAFAHNPFTFTFLDTFFNRQYLAVIQFETLFSAFALVAIGIACIGLFSLLAFLIQERFKEIGVRKVLGASTQSIVFLLTKDFLQLVILSNIVAWPLAWLVMNNWLQDFAYRIHIPLWIFMIAGLIALFISMITIGLQSIRVASANPVKSLQTE